jgi:hypothetical protein
VPGGQAKISNLKQRKKIFKKINQLLNININKGGLQLSYAIARNKCNSGAL